MTSAFEQVDVDTRCLSEECGKQGCEVGLAGAPRPFHLIDMDGPGTPARGERCDYILVGAGLGQLAKHPVSFRGKPHAIRLMKCGDDIEKVLR